MACDQDSAAATWVGDGDPAVDAFLSTLAAAQARFFASIQDAACELGESHDRLRVTATQHLRLLQQFLDGQRSIIRRRAEVDRKVAAMGVAAGSIDTPFSITGAAQCDEMSADQEQSLRDLLDGWWRAEIELGRRELEDAETRAAILEHFCGGREPLHPEPGNEGSLASSRRGDSTWLTSSTESVASLPPSVVAALDAADPGDIDGALLALLDVVRPTGTAASPMTSGVPIAEPPDDDDDDDDRDDDDGDGDGDDDHGGVGGPSVCDAERRLDADDDDVPLAYLLGAQAGRGRVAEHAAAEHADAEHADAEHADADRSFDDFWARFPIARGRRRRGLLTRSVLPGASMVAVATAVVTWFG